MTHTARATRERDKNFLPFVLAFAALIRRAGGAGMVKATAQGMALARRISGVGKVEAVN